MYTKRLFVIFATSFILNAVWENIHSLLYANYQGGKITEFILLRATLADAIMITIITIPFIFVPFLSKRKWLIIIVGVILSISIEWWALSTGRWAYNAYMPLIPLLSVGLTPTIQLGLLGYISFKVNEYFFKNS